MRLAKKRRKTRLEMDMTPMIDVAFQLIIFFMTVSQMSQVNQESVQLPKQAGIEDQQPRTLVINVTEAGVIRVSGETLTVAGLIARVNQELVLVGDNPDQLHVVLRGDERAESRGVNEVVRALGQLRVSRIRIAVEAGSG